MAGLNRASLIGHLGRDPELRFTQAGDPVATFSLATNERWTDKSTGEQKDRVEWHQIVAWGRTGEMAAKYLRKGSKVYVDGRLQTREWQDKDGNKRRTTEINAQNVIYLDSKDGGRHGDGPPADDVPR